MPVDAVAFGATVTATHFYEVPRDWRLDVSLQSELEVMHRMQQLRRVYPEASEARLRLEVQAQLKITRASMDHINSDNSRESSTFAGGGLLGPDHGEGGSSDPTPVEVVQALQVETILDRANCQVLSVLQRMRGLATAKHVDMQDGNSSADDSSGAIRVGIAAATSLGSVRRPKHSRRGKKRAPKSIRLAAPLASDPRWQNVPNLLSDPDWIPVSGDPNKMDDMFYPALRRGENVMRARLGLPRLRRGAEEALVRIARRDHAVWKNDTKGSKRHPASQGTEVPDMQPAVRTSRSRRQHQKPEVPGLLDPKGDAYVSRTSKYNDQAMRTSSKAVSTAAVHPTRVDIVSEEPDRSESSFVVNARRFDYKRAPITRIVQNPVIMVLVSTVMLLDMFLVRARLYVNAPELMGSDPDEVIRVSIFWSRATYVPALLILLLGLGLGLRRYLLIGQYGIKHVFISSDDENGCGYGVLNLVAIFVCRVGVSITRSRMLQEPAIGCVVFHSEFFLTAIQLTTILFVVVLIYSGDLHGVLRPSTCLRYVVLVLSFTIGIMDVLAAGLEDGVTILTNQAIPFGIPDDHPVLRCRQNVSPDHDIPVGQRI